MTLESVNAWGVELDHPIYFGKKQFALTHSYFPHELMDPGYTGVAAVTATLASGGTAPPAATGSGRACAEVLESFVSDNPQNFSFRQPNFGADIASKKDELFAFYGGGAETIQLRELSQIDENVKVLRPIM